MNHLITREAIDQIVNYLSEKPYKEVVGIIAHLLSLPPDNGEKKE